jgi:hypothetical protein
MISHWSEPTKMSVLEVKRLLINPICERVTNSIFGLFPVNKNRLQSNQHYCWLAMAKMLRSKIQKFRALLMLL